MNNFRRIFFKTALAGLVSPALLRARVLGQQSTSPERAVESLIKSVRYLGNQFLDNAVGITGMDGATSILLPSGKSLWVFGDTVEGPFKSIHGLDLSRLRSNTAAVVPTQNASRGIERFQFLTTADGGRPRQIIPFAADEDPAMHRVWAIHGCCVGKHIYLFYHRITLLKGVDVFASFQLDGMGVARGEIGDFRFTRLNAPDGSREFWKGDQPSFGVFVERTADYLYLWGCLQTGMHLARVRLDRTEDLSGYEYLVEAPDASHPDVRPRWAKKFEPTAKLFDAVPNEMSAAYNSYLGRYVAIHCLNREPKILMRTAPQITGPWSEGEIVFQPDRVADVDLFYAAKEHPELAREGGRVLYVTFVNSTTYVPQLVELTLK